MVLVKRFLSEWWCYLWQTGSGVDLLLSCLSDELRWKAAQGSLCLSLYPPERQILLCKCHLTADTYLGLSDSHLWYISTSSPRGTAFKSRYSLALFMQGIPTLHSLNSVAATLTVSLPKGSTSIDCCTTQLIPTSSACWSSTSVWPGSSTQSYDFKGCSLTCCASAAKTQIPVRTCRDCTCAAHVW